MAHKYDAVVGAVASTVWLLEENKARQLLEVLRIRANGGRIPAAEVRRVVAQAKQNRGPQLTNGKVAVLPVYGVVAPRMTMMTRMSGGTAAEELGNNIVALAADPSVSAIVLDVDSPGGAATGIPELAAKIRAAAEQKRIIAMVNHLAASAAYWIASQASEIVSSPSGEVGSIGVYMVHFDESEMYADAGIKPTIVRAGKYKAEGNPFEPLGDEAKAAMQATIDDWYSQFVGAVAKGRGVSAKEVRDSYGQGRVVSSTQALKSGMIDRIDTMDNLLTELTGGAGVTNGRRAHITPMRRIAIRDGFVVVAFEHSWSNTVSGEPEWGSVDKSALPRIAFAGKGDADKKSTWSYPHHFVKGGTKKDDNGVWTDGELHVHTGGVNAAWSAAQGGRSGQKASQAVIDHLQHHRRALGLDKSDKTDDEKSSRRLELAGVAASGVFIDPFETLAAVFTAVDDPDEDEEYEDPTLPNDEDQEDQQDGGDDEDTENEDTENEDTPGAKKKAKRAAAPPPNDDEAGEDGEDDDQSDNPNARAGRGDVARASAGSPHQPAPRAEESTVSAPNTAAPGGAPPTAEAAVELERKRTKEIRALCREHRVDPEQADAIVDSGCTVDQAATKILELSRAKQAAKVPVITGVTDRSEGHLFKTAGEQFYAIVRAGMPGGRIDPRLHQVNQRVIAGPSGMSEGVGADGGFFIQPELLPGVIDPVYADDPILSRVFRMPIGSESNGVKYNVVDETSRATGSRWGGIQMYWAGEADTATAKKPKLRQMELNLKKLIGIAYLTDELTQDAPAAQALLVRAFQAELSFMLADSIFRGTGAGQPLGFLNSGAFIKQAIEGSETLANQAQYLATNIPKMLARIPAALWGSVIWLYNQELLPYLLNTTVGAASTGVVPVFVAAGGFANRPTDTILGRSAYASELCEAVGTPGDLIAIVPDQYHMADKGGPQQMYSLHVRFLNDEMAFRITYRCDGSPVWRTTVTPYKGANSRSFAVGLDTRS